MSVDQAREQVLTIAEDFEANLFRLLRVQTSLPLPSGENEEDVDADPDPASEMHAVIGCVIRDALEPLIRDLRAAASYQPGSERTPLRRAVDEKAGAGSGRRPAP